MLFALKSHGQSRSCRIVDRGPFGVEARICDGDVKRDFTRSGSRT
jgi:hypothetical protein